MKQTFIQLKDLPFSNKGDIWELEEGEIKINDCVYSSCSLDLVKYYTLETGQIDMTQNGWFDIAGSEEEKRLEKIRIKRDLEFEKDFCLIRLAELEEAIQDLGVVK